MKAVIESIGAVGSRVRLGAHEISFDQPTGVPGGQNRGASPLDVLIVSVGACAHYFAAAFLQGRNLPVDKLRVEVEWAKDRAPSPRVSTVSIHVILPPDVPEQFLPAIERAVRNCPAYGTLLHPPEVQLYIDKGSTARADAEQQGAP